MKILKQIADQGIQEINEEQLIDEIGADNVEQIKCDLQNMSRQTYNVDDVTYIINNR